MSFSKKKNRNRPKAGNPRRGNTTLGHDDATSSTARKDYYVPDAVEITPHPNQRIVATLRQPIMDRRLKYSILETASLASSNATSSTAIGLLTVSQGTSDITRTGDRIRLKRMWIQGYLQGNAAATGPALTRVIVINDITGTGITVASQVVQHSTGFGPMGSYSRDFGDQYQVLYDTVHVVYPAATQGQMDLFRTDRAMTIDCEFTAGGTTPSTNNIKLFFVTNIGANFPVATFSSTLWYEDLDA